MIPSLTRLAAMGLLFLSLPPAGRAQSALPEQAYTVAPNPAPINSAFTLYLNGGSFPCGTVFTRQSAVVTGNRIDLTFEADSPIYLPDAAPGAKTAPVPPICLYDQAATSPVETLSYGNIVPRFKLPALLAGDYEVWATQAYACQFTQPACLIKTQSLYAGILKVSAAPKPMLFHISPNTVESGKAFILNALTDGYDCGFTYDSLATIVSGGKISLIFRAHAHPESACVSQAYAFGPAFRLPALAAGKYVVEIAPYPECPPGGIDCGMLRNLFYDTLTVKDVVLKNGWFLKERQVAPDKAFTMQLLNNLYGNCQTSFSHQSLTVAKDSISVSFVAETDKKRICVMDIRPYGPAIEMPAMKAGSYPVYVNEMPACLYSNPRCEILRLPNSIPSDTLLVTQSTAVLISALRAGGLKASFEGAAVGFDLPTAKGAGTADASAWRAELLTLRGERLAAGSVRSNAQARASLPLPSRPGPGIYLLKLQDAAGGVRIVPVVRHD